MIRAEHIDRINRLNT